MARTEVIVWMSLRGKPASPGQDPSLRGPLLSGRSLPLSPAVPGHRRGDQQRCLLGSLATGRNKSLTSHFFVVRGGRWGLLGMGTSIV